MLTAAGLTLRPWSAWDAPAVLAAFAEPEMERQAGAVIGTAEDAAAWVRVRQEHWQAGSAYSFAAVANDGGGLGGVLGGVMVSSVDRRHLTGWVSYWTTAAARGRGVATSACLALSEWAFSDLGLFRLELGHRVNNPASCKVASRAGFRAEGRERQKLLYDGVRYDVELHARLATDPLSPGVHHFPV
jgi:RimJ/RimL family protein N-acetyltransferase